MGETMTRIPLKSALLATALALAALVVVFRLGTPLQDVDRGSRNAPRAGAGRNPVVVIGIDGGEWRVVRQLWDEGRLPNLRRLADRGVSGTLRTAYNSSPVIWTTVATGVVPEVHGITDFVVPTPQGDVPISSEVRKVPALWNMTTRAGRRVAVLGWWGSWPAEEVDGVVVTDRALLDLDHRVFPAEYLPRFLENVRAAEADPGLFRFSSEPERRDLAVAETARRLARDRYDLLLVYFRSPDVVSHNAWKGWEPAAFPGADPAELAELRGEVPRIYEAVDREIGRIVAAAPPEANVFVLSDHGFHAAHPEEVKVLLDMDTLLERLGWLTRDASGAVDLARSTVYTHGTPSFRRPKLLRFAAGDRLGPKQRAALRRRLTADLARVAYEGGAPVFWVRDPRPRRGEEGGDLVAVVSPDRATRRLRVDGEPLDGAVEEVSRISGTHTRTTHGIFLAAGPDVDPAADLEGIHIHDVAPTLLFTLGLPVAEDFAGRPWTALFREEFLRANPLRTVRTWGALEGRGSARSSSADEKLLEELRALGYIN